MEVTITISEEFIQKLKPDWTAAKCVEFLNEISLDLEELLARVAKNRIEDFLYFGS